MSTSSLTPILDRAAALARLELQVTRQLDGLIQGDFLGWNAGPGSEPADARAYQAGDDARRIDWNLTARSMELQVRRTQADRELETWLVADRSASLDFGTARCEKRELVLAALAAFGLRTVRNGNRVGVVVAGGPTIITRPPRASRRDMLATLTEIHATERYTTRPTQHAQLDAALQRVDRIARRRGVVVVVSDFLDASPWAATIGHLALRHDVVAVQVVDPRELELPAVGLLKLVDTESGRVVDVQTNSPRLRERYRAAAAGRHDAIATAVRHAGARHLVLRTDRDWLLDIASFLARDGRRRHHAKPVTVPR